MGWREREAKKIQEGYNFMRSRGFMPYLEKKAQDENIKPNLDYDVVNTTDPLYDTAMRKAEADIARENLRKANLVDLTWNSAKRGYYNSKRGENIAYQIGKSKVSTPYDDKLESNTYKFEEPTNLLARGTSLVFDQVGQYTSRFTGPITIGATVAGGAAGGPMGAKEGFVLGNAATTGLTEAGLAYDEYINDGIDPKIAAPISLGVGAVNTGIELVQLPGIGKLISGPAKQAVKEAGREAAQKGVKQAVKSLVQKGINKVVKEGADELTEKGVKQTIKNGIKNFIKNTAEETVEEVAQEGVTIAGGRIGDALSGTDNHTLLGDAQRLGDTALSSALTFGMLGTVGGARSGIHTFNTYKNIGDVGKQFSGDSAAVKNIIDSGLSADENSSAYKMASEAQDRLNNNKKLSDIDVGLMTYANINEIGTPYRGYGERAQTAEFGENGVKQYNAQQERRQRDGVEQGAGFDQEFGYYYKAGKNDIPLDKVPEYAGARTMDNAARQGAYYSGYNDMQVETDTLGTEANANRFRENVDKVFKGKIDTQQSIKIGKTPQILQDYGANDLPLTIKQSTMHKIAYPNGYIGAKEQGHNLGIPALKSLPSQIADPIAILKSNTQDNSLVLLTQWRESNGNDVIIPIHLDKNGTIDIENKIASAYGTGSQAIFGTDENGNVDYSNVLYTKNNEDIHTLLADRLQLPVNESDDTLINNSISQDGGNVKNIVSWDINGVKGSGVYVGTVENNGKRFARVKMQNGKTADIDMAFVSDVDNVDNVAADTKNVPYDTKNVYSDTENGVSDTEKAVSKSESKTSTSEKKASAAERNISPRVTKKEREFFVELSKAINTPIEFVDSIKSPSGQAANGAYINGKIVLAEDSDRPLIEVAKHEITHSLKENAPKEYAEYEAYAIEALKKNGRYDDLFNEYSELYGTADEGVINEEIAADATQMFLTDEAAINELAQENVSLARKFLDCIRSFIEKIKSIFADGGIDEVTASFETEQLKNAEKLWIKAIAAAEKGQSGAVNGDGKYQAKKNVNGNNIYDYTKSFADQIDDWKQGKIPKYDSLLIGQTPDVYKKIGFNALPVTINQRHIDYLINGTKDMDHYLGDSMTKQLPQKIKEPIAVIKSQSQSNRVVSLLDFVHNGKQIVVPVEIDGYGTQNNVLIDSNAVTSVYAKGNAVTKLLKDAINEEMNGSTSVYYFDKNKAAVLLQIAGLQLPSHLFRNNGFIHSIHEKSSIVKPKFENVTYSQQFKRWFGDWENNPNTASKVVNSDGTPKIVYHQTKDDFSVFDTSKKGAGYYDSEVPTGIFLKPTSDDIGMEGKKQMSLYANIRNPISFKNRAEAEAWYNKNISGYKEQKAKLDNIIEHYEKLYAEAEKRSDKWYDENYEDFLNGKITEEEAEKHITGELDEILVKWKNAENNIRRVQKQILDNYFENSNYDGMIIEEDEGSFGRKVKTYIAFNPEQIKSATDNIGTFDNNNPDIRYQLRRQESLERENEKLRAINDSLREQFYLTEGVKVNRKQIDKAAKNFLKLINSKYDKVEFSKELAKIYDTLANSSYDNEAYTAALYELEQLASDALYESETLDKTLYNQYADLRSYVRETGITLNEQAKSDFGGKEGFEDFRKSHFGSIKIVNNGLPVDVFYEELMGMYPEWFSDEIQTQSDQLIRIANVLDNIKPVYENPYLMDIDEMSKTAAYELFMEFFGMGDQTTFADRKQAQLNNLKLKTNSHIAALRQQYKTRHTKNILAQRDMYQERIRKLIDARENEIEETNQYYRDMIKRLRESKNESHDKKMKKQAEHYKGRISDTIARKNESHDKKMKEQAEHYKGRISDTIARKNEEIEEAKKYYRDMVKRFRESKNESHDKKMKKQAEHYKGRISYTIARKNDKIRQTKLIDSMYYGAKIAKLKRAYNDKMKGQAEHYKERISDAIARKNEQIEGIKKKYNERIDRLKTLKKAHIELERDRYKQYKENAKERAKERAEVRKFKKNIKKDWYALSDMLLKPTDKKHIPEDMRDAIATVLNTIDIRSGFKNKDGTDTKVALKLSSLYDKFKGFEQKAEMEDILAVMNPDFFANFEELRESFGGNEITIQDMTSTQLKQVAGIIRDVKHCVQNANRSFIDDKKRKISEIARDIISDLRAKGVRIDRGKFGWMSDASGKLKDFELGMLTPYSFFHQLGENAEGVYWQMRKGLNEKVRMVKTATDYFADIKKRYKINIKNISGKKAERINFTVESGEKISMNKAEIMSLYLLNKREQGQKHIYGGGITLEPEIMYEKDGKNRVAKIKSEKRPVQVTVNDVLNITGALSENERAFADMLGKFLSEDCAEWGNEVSMKLYGYKKFVEQFYFPLNSDKNYLVERFNSANDLASIKNMGFTKQTNAFANNPVIISDVLDVFCRHVDDMSTYGSLALAVNDFQRIYNFKDKNLSLKGEIEAAYGKAAQGYITEFMRSVNGISTKSITGTLPAKLVGNVKAAAVGWNLRVVIQQPTAIFRATSMVDAKYFLQDMNISKEGIKKSIEEMHNYSAIALYKSWGNYSLDMGRQIKEVITDDISTIDKIKEAGMWAAGKADDVTWSVIWNAVKNEIGDTRKDLTVGSKAYWEAVEDRFDHVIDETQVVDSVFHRSSLMRNEDGLVRQIMSFMGEPTQSYNMIRRSAYDLHKKATPENKKKLVRAVSAFLVTTVVNSAIKSIVDSARDDDDEKKFLEKWFKYFISGIWQEPFSMLPYIKDLVSVAQGYNVDRMDMSGFADLISSVVRAIKGGQAAGYSGFDIILSTVNATGLGAKNVFRELKAMTNFILSTAQECGADTDWIEYHLLKAKFDINNSKNRTKFYAQLYEAYDRGKEKGDLSTYNKILSDMVRHGIPLSNAESNMNNRDKKALSEDKELVKIVENVENNSKASDIFNDDVDKALEMFKNADDKNEDRYDDKIIKAAIKMIQKGISDVNYSPNDIYNMAQKDINKAREMCNTLIELGFYKREDLEAALEAIKKHKGGNISIESLVESY